MTSAAPRGRAWLILAPLLGLGLGAFIALLPLFPTDWAFVSAAFLLLLIGLLLAPNADRVIVALLVFDMAVPLDMYMGFREDAADLSALPGLPISVTTLLLGAAYLHWTLARLAGTKRADPGWGAAVAPLLVYFVAVLISWPNSLDPQLAAFEIGLVLQMVLLFGYIVHVLRSVSDLAYVARVMVAVLVVETLIMGVLLVIGRSLEIGPVSARLDTEPFFRVAGTVGAPNAAGAFLVLMGLTALGWWLAAPRNTDKAFASVAFALSLFMLMFTLSRGAWLGLAVGGLLFLIVGAARGWLSRRFLLSVTVVGVIVAVAMAGPVMERLLGGEASQISSRTALTEVGVEMFLENPVVGVGANSFAAVLPAHLDARFEGDFINVVHNKYVLVAAETGLIGLVAFLIFLGLTLARGWRALALVDRPYGPLVLGLLAGLVGVMAHMFFDLFHGRTDTQMLITVCAILTAAWRMSEATSPRPVVAAEPAIRAATTADNVS